MTVENREPLATTFFFILLVASTISVGWLFSPYANDVIFALLFSLLTAPLRRRIAPRVKNRSWVGALASCAVIVVVVAGPVAFLVAGLATEARSAYDAGAGSLSVERIQEVLFGGGVFATWMRGFADRFGVEVTPASVKNAFVAVSTTISGFLYAQVQNLLANVVSALFHFALMLVAMFYIALDGARLRAFAFRVSPLPDEQEELLAAKFTDVGGAIVVGNGLSSALQGLLGGIAMAIVGVPSPVLWGTVMSIVAFLPMVGISAISIPWAAYLAIQGHTVAAIGLVAFCAAEGAIIENVVKTKLIGERMKMHSAIVFGSILGGLGMFGIAGLLYGPMLVALFLTLVELYERHYKGQLSKRFA